MAIETENELLKCVYIKLINLKILGIKTEIILRADGKLNNFVLSGWTTFILLWLLSLSEEDFDETLKNCIDLGNVIYIEMQHNSYASIQVKKFTSKLTHPVLKIIFEE